MKNNQYDHFFIKYIYIYLFISIKMLCVDDIEMIDIIKSFSLDENY